MSSSKTKDYDVETILSKRIDGKGQIFYLIKWKGYSAAHNTWEPEDHVTNCQNLIKQFEGEEEKKNKSRNSNSNESQGHTNTRSTRSSVLTPKQSINKSERSTRSSNRSLPMRQHNKRASNNDDMFTGNEDENDNGLSEKKSLKSVSSKRSRKNTSDSDSTSSIDSYDSDILDISKLDQILDVRRNKKTNTVEYYIQVKKATKPLWINSTRLAEDYNQQVIDFLEEKYV
ncbi:unnamed protein product [Rotaria sp. Silwood2]|nr:unnamed protein product [Rotaria sp. Silwood2]CAF4320701.1 unnamed protein product [Rotaria sp. Silwood2]